jgi:O-acetylserine/cysteine efflux transporter
MRLFDSVLAILVAMLWGINFIAAKYGMAHFAPFFLTGLRFALTGLLMVLFVARPARAQVPALVKLALVMGVLQFATMYVSLDMGLDISSVAIIGQMGVPFSCLIGALFMNDRLGKWRLSGMVLAFAGMVIVAGTPNVLQHPLAFAISTFSALCWAIGNMMAKHLKGVGSMQMLAWMSLFSAPQLFAVSLLLEGNQWPLILNAPMSAWLALGYTVFFSTIVAYGLWYYLIRRHPVSQVAPYSLLTPLAGIACGHIYFSEVMTPEMIIGGAIVIIGVAIIVVRRPKLLMPGKPT